MMHYLHTSKLPLIIWLVFLVAMLPSPGQSEVRGMMSLPTPTETISVVLTDLKNLFLKNPKATDLQIKITIEWALDLQETAKRAIGTSWKDLNEEQQKEYVTAFSQLLLNTYISKLKKINKVKINIGRETVDGNKASVTATILDGGQEYPVIFKLHIIEGHNWRVYDLVVENIGLVSNYRNEFAAIIRKEGIEGLIKRLKDKNNKNL